MCCQIDENWTRNRYNTRIIRKITNKFNASKEKTTRPYDILMTDDDDMDYPHGHYQSAFRCFPNHHLQNLTTHNVTANDAVIAWSFNQWDVALVRRLWLEVELNNEEISRRTLNRDHELEQNQMVYVGGLNDCQQYVVTVFYDFTYDYAYRPKLLVNTTCKTTSNMETWLKLPIMEMVIGGVMMCILMALIACLAKMLREILVLYTPVISLTHLRYFLYVS